MTEVELRASFSPTNRAARCSWSSDIRSHRYSGAASRVIAAAPERRSVLDWSSLQQLDAEACAGRAPVFALKRDRQYGLLLLGFA